MLMQAQTLFGDIARRRAGGAGGGGAPSVIQAFGGSSTANINDLAVAGVSAPAGTRAVIASFGSYLGFNFGAQQTITSLTCAYGGQAMTRIDGLGLGFPIDGFRLWTFALLSPSTIPLNGDVVIAFTMTGGGKVEIRTMSILTVAHNADLQVETLDEFLTPDPATTITNNVAHGADTLLVSITGFKGSAALAGDGGWIEKNRQSALGSNAATSGRILLETKQAATAGNASHLSTMGNAEYGAGVVYGLKDA